MLERYLRLPVFLKLLVNMVFVLALLGLWIWACAYLSFGLMWALSFIVAVVMALPVYRLFSARLKGAIYVPVKERTRWFKSWQMIAWAALAAMHLWIAIGRKSESELFLFGLFLSIAISLMMMIRNAGVYFKQDEIRVVYRSIYGMLPKHVSALIEDRMGLNLQLHIYLTGSRTLYKKDFAEADWEKLISLFSDWAKRHSVTFEEWALAERNSAQE